MVPGLRLRVVREVCCCCEDSPGFLQADNATSSSSSRRYWQLRQLLRPLQLLVGLQL
jgi:hypothetical protein